MYFTFSQLSWRFCSQLLSFFSFLYEHKSHKTHLMFVRWEFTELPASSDWTLSATVFIYSIYHSTLLSWNDMKWGERGPKRWKSLCVLVSCGQWSLAQRNAETSQQDDFYIIADELWVLAMALNSMAVKLHLLWLPWSDWLTGLQSLARRNV